MNSEDGPRTSYQWGRISGSRIFTIKDRHSVTVYCGVNGLKHVTYDDHSISEWAVGQLANVYAIQDPNLVKKVLLQVILVLEDSTSLP